MSTSQVLHAPFADGGPSEIDAAIGRRLLEIALSQGGDDADLYFEYNAAASFGYEDEKVKSVGQGITLGLGVRVVNGSAVYGYEISKARQLTLLRSLGLGFPAARVIHGGAQAPVAAEGLRFPVVVKANIGGSGAGIVRYNTPADLKRAADANEIDLGVDGTALVQEYVTPAGGYITRAETLGGKFLYAINVHTTGESFNLCPADICQTTGGVELVRSACALDAP